MSAVEMNNGRTRSEDDYRMRDPAYRQALKEQAEFMMLVERGNHFAKVCWQEAQIALTANGVFGNALADIRSDLR